jgi:hypothetical protein
MKVIDKSGATALLLLSMIVTCSDNDGDDDGAAGTTSRAASTSASTGDGGAAGSTASAGGTSMCMPACASNLKCCFGTAQPSSTSNPTICATLVRCSIDPPGWTLRGVVG